MAKKQKREVVRIKWMGLACFGITVVLYALAIWGSNLVGATTNNIFGYTIEHFSNPDNIAAVFEDAIMVRIISFFAIMFISVLSLLASFKLIFMFFNILGFIGKKDAYKTAKKFSKFVKRAFAAVGLEITALIFFSLDDGVFAKDVTTFFTVVGIAFAVLYLGTRAYRWLLVERMPLADMIFILIKDVMFVGCLIFMASLIDTRLLTNIVLLETMFNLPQTSSTLAEMPYLQLMDVIIGFIQFLVVTSLIRNTLRRFTLNNYKKPAYKKHISAYITLFIFVTIFAALKEILYPIIVSQNTAGIDVVATILAVLPTIIPYFAVILAIAFAGAVEGGYVKEIQLYVPCAKPVYDPAEEIDEAEKEDVSNETESKIETEEAEENIAE
ncbi:MAG: hypothetical protein IKV61_06650 [Clostridia bacterium]|nr:hypothetical protein [Clostridia bacterium]